MLSAVWRERCGESGVERERCGEKGVERTFTILKEELERTMGLVGARTIAELRSKGNEIFVKRERLRNSS